MVAELKEVILKVEQLHEEDQRRIAKLLENEINAGVDVEVKPDEGYDEQYIHDLRQKAKSWLGTINPDEWLKEVRDGYE